MLVSFGCSPSKSAPKTTCEPREPVIETGIASHYADSLAGRPTASGEAYDPRKFTCAHPKLPFQTMLEVVRVKTGRRVRCRVNDRGPFAKGRIIDLSRAAAEALGMDGITKVRLRRVKVSSQ